jgi:predicted Fe-Mo cluster-binding NifX family protein
MKIAVTSQNFRTVTGHAGNAHRFIVFDTDVGGRVIEVDRLDLEPGMAFHHFAGVVHPIDGVDVLVTAGSGDGFIAKMAGRGVRVIRTGQSDPVLAVTEVLGGKLTAPLPHPDHAPVGFTDAGEPPHGGCCGCSCGTR